MNLTKYLELHPEMLGPQVLLRLTALKWKLMKAGTHSFFRNEAPNRDVMEKEGERVDQGKRKKPFRLLVVDDDVSLLELSSQILRTSGYEVVVAADGAAGWETLYASDFDLLITDNNMPNLTGIELLKKVHAARISIPTIMTTGAWPGEEFNQFPWIRPYATLIKPYSVMDLLQKVRDVLSVTEVEPRESRG